VALDVELDEIGLAEARDEVVQRSDGDRAGGSPVEAREAGIARHIGYPPGRQRRHREVAGRLVQRRAAGFAADRGRHQRHVRVACEQRAQHGEAVDLRFDCDDARAQPPPAARAAADMGADVEAQPALGHERPVQPREPRPAPGLPMVERERARKAPAATDGLGYGGHAATLPEGDQAGTWVGASRAA